MTVSITSIDDAHISFSGGDYWRIEGSMDRVTGDMEVRSRRWLASTPRVLVSSQVLALKCRPAQRMF
jgi:hypothetical protein